MKTVSFFDYVIVIGVCIVFPILIPVALGIVAFMAISAGAGGNDE